MEVILLMPRGDYESTPCVKSLAEELAINGITVQVLTIRNSAFPNAKIEGAANNNLKIYYCPFVKQSMFWENVPVTSLLFSIWAYYRILTAKPDYIIPCGVRALLSLGAYSMFSKTKVVYNCLELYFLNNSKSFKKALFKKVESFLNRRSCLTIIQDKSRASLLAKENELDINSIMLLPNSTRGRSVSKLKSARDDLLKKYNLPSTAKLIIYSGSFFAPWGMINDVLQSVETWPENWYLILHSRINASDVDTACSQLSLHDSDKIIISNESLSNSEYEYLVQGCDVGIALYNGNVGDNMKYVGLSSGKLAQYLKFGLPIIVNSLPTWDDVIPKYHCGATIHSYHDINIELSNIFNDNDNYSSGAKNAFDSLFCLDDYIEKIVHRLNN